ncbi:unnamed protein product, partial [Mesorhabditis spiculigera]
MKNVLVELYDRDFFSYNDKLAEMLTAKDGNFLVSGGEYERGIEPFLLLHHNCLAPKNCSKVVRYHVPQEYVHSTYEMSFIPLDLYQDDEKTICRRRKEDGTQGGYDYFVAL